MLKRQKNMVVREWKQDHINLIQFPRCGCIPTPSPFSLKLETWLRFTKLPYTNISNEFKVGSAKGQVPFIELNGRQLADSNFIIENLKNIFNVNIDRQLSTRERADERAYSVLIEESLFRTLMYNRSRNFKWLGTDKGFARHFTGVKKFIAEKLAVKHLQNKLKSAANAQGIGRHSAPEVDEIAKKDLSALSTLLGDKPYFFGSHPSTLDATAFGVLAQFIETPLENTDVKTFIEQSTPNLLEFVRRIQREYWPDWDLLCQKLLMNATDTPTHPPVAETQPH
ncbi:hypothetical protein M3Y97_00377000 [Aphelenchoides bicaudatus]|nr:hypothetical protein M3Y97_00377000 [Aphelenchoides bicaudatus]